MHKIIVREDYRVYYYMVDPTSYGHQESIAVVTRKINAFFESREMEVDRRIHRSAQGKGFMWIHFENLNDSNMFYMAMAEHINNKGVRFD